MLEVSGIANKEKNLFINEQIRAKEVMVIGPSGEQLGTKALKDALTLASYAGFDLVLINPNGNPPVCKIMDYNKFKYENKKKSKENLQADIANRRIDKIDNISIDSNTSLESRILNFFQKIKNPYAIRVGNIVVEMEFSDNSNISPMECIDATLINEYKMREMSNV